MKLFFFNETPNNQHRHSVVPFLKSLKALWNKAVCHKFISPVPLCHALCHILNR